MTWGCSTCMATSGPGARRASGATIRSLETARPSEDKQEDSLRIDINMVRIMRGGSFASLLCSPDAPIGTGSYQSTRFITSASVRHARLAPWPHPAQRAAAGAITVSVLLMVASLRPWPPAACICGTVGLSTVTLLVPWNAFAQNSPKPPQGTVREIVITEDTTLDNDAVLNAQRRHQDQQRHYQRQWGHPRRSRRPELFRPQETQYVPVPWMRRRLGVRMVAKGSSP